jgi:DNA topoisomerase-1
VGYDETEGDAMAQTWILRKGSKRGGFRYLTTGGKPVSDGVRARIEALRIPPAWTDVHVAASPSAAVQAWGFDAKGRKQYRYHDAAAERGQLRKYYRVRQMARDLPAIRQAVSRDLTRVPGKALTRRRVCAGVVRLIGEAFFRVGGERYAAENRTFGISTLRKKHVTTHDDRVVFDYVGKKSIRQRQTVTDPELVAFVKELLDTPGPRLLRYQEDGAWSDLSARDVNEYLHDVLGVPYSAKDFRTWGGTLRLATILADIGPAPSEREARKNVVTALRLVAAELGNTPTICRQSYVHPLVIARYLDEGETIAPFITRATLRAAGAGTTPAPAAQLPEERGLIRFLDRYFPERRKKARDRRRRGRDAADDRRDARAVA